MLPIFNGLRDINFLSTLVRMLLATLCGALIGLERSYKNRPAGFRTHMLVCIGACVASLTGHYIYLELHYPADISRIGPGSDRPWFHRCRNHYCDKETDR